MITRFRILAQVDFLHDYYAAGTCEDFAVAPSSDTAVRMAALRLRSKVVGSSLLILVPVDEAGKATAGLPPDLRLVFHLELTAPAFLTVSNVDATSLRTRRFHFTNLAANAVGAPPATVLNLTRTLDAYANAKAYVPGDQVRIGGDVFECVRAATGQAPNAPNTAFWAAKGSVQAASSQDLVPFKNQIANFTLLTAARAFRIRIFGLDPAAHAYTRLIREDVVSASALETSKEVQADLSALPPGRYRLDINGEIFEAWFDDEAAARGSFGVIEIFNHLPKTDAYSLVDAADKVREITYAIRFANRRAFWKYLTPLHRVGDIRPTADHTLPSPFTAGSNDPSQPAQKDFFLSDRPLPLSESRAENQFDLLIGSETRPAPKPDPRVPGMLTQIFDAPSQAYLDSLCTIRLNH
jgi:hypothetical protein